MTIKRIGQSMVEFIVAGEGGGTRHLARVNSIALVSETDCLGNEILLSVGNKTFQIDASLDEMRDILVSAASRQSGARQR